MSDQDPPKWMTGLPTVTAGSTVADHQVFADSASTAVARPVPRRIVDGQVDIVSTAEVAVLIDPESPYI